MNPYKVSKITGKNWIKSTVYKHPKDGCYSFHCKSNLCKV